MAIGTSHYRATVLIHVFYTLRRREKQLSTRHSESGGSPLRHSPWRKEWRRLEAKTREWRTPDNPNPDHPHTPIRQYGPGIRANFFSLPPSSRQRSRHRPSPSGFISQTWVVNSHSLAIRHGATPLSPLFAFSHPIGSRPLPCGDRPKSLAISCLRSATKGGHPWCTVICSVGDTDTGSR